MIGRLPERAHRDVCSLAYAWRREIWSRADCSDLPASERAELAADLFASLHGEPEADVEAAWASEIERRTREVLANPDDDLSWESVHAELAEVSRVR